MENYNSVLAMLVNDLNFGTSFVALRALVREIIQNIIHTLYVHSHPHTLMTEIGFSSIVRLWLRAFGAQPPSHELVIASMT